MYALRKSYGPYSQGTRVERSEAGGLVQYAIFDKQHKGTAIPAEFVVKRRNMTRYGPAVNSRERRRREKAAKRALGLLLTATPDDAARKALGL